MSRCRAGRIEGACLPKGQCRSQRSLLLSGRTRLGTLQRQAGKMRRSWRSWTRRTIAFYAVASTVRVASFGDRIIASLIPSVDSHAQLHHRPYRCRRAPVEAMRRLRVALETASGKGDTYSRRMWWLTTVLAALTLVQAIAVLPTVISVVRSWFRH
jgi:hypothetical protein